MVLNYQYSGSRYFVRLIDGRLRASEKVLPVTGLSIGLTGTPELIFSRPDLQLVVRPSKMITR